MQRAKFILGVFLLSVLLVGSSNASEYDISASVSSSPELLQAEQLLSTLTVNPDHATIGQQIAATLMLKGIAGKPITGHTVMIQFQYGNKTIAVNGTSDAAGQFTAQFTPPEEGTVTIRAVDTSYSPSLAIMHEDALTVRAAATNPLQAIVSFFAHLFGK